MLVNIVNRLTHLHGFQLLVLLPPFIERTLFVFTNRINILNLKLNSHKLVIVAKGFLKLTNLYMLTKQKSPSFPRNLALRPFGKLPIVFSTKVNLIHLIYSTTQRCCLLYLIKQNCLLKTFLRALILMTHVSL